jgi:hypothetical protein
MHTTKGNWVMNMLLNFDFIIINVENNFSSSTLFNICTFHMIMFQFHQFHIFLELADYYRRCSHQVPHFGQRIGVKRWSHACYSIQCHLQLEHASLVIKVINIENFRPKVFHPIQQLGFAIAKSHFDYLKLFWEKCLMIWM